MDPLVGATYHHGPKAPNGAPMWGKFVVREIVPPEGLDFISSFSDEEGGTTRHPSHTSWPLQMHSTFTFEELPGGKTKFIVSCAAHNPTPEEQQVFDTSHPSMNQGWIGTLEQLEAYLAKAKVAAR